VDLWGVVVVLVVVVVASALQGAVGFGANLVAAPLLVLVDPVFVPGPMIVMALALNGLMMWRDREPVEASHIGLALAGRIPGSALGAAALVAIPSDQLGLFFGSLVLVAVVLSFSPFDVPITRPSIAGAGVASGFMGTSIGIGGPPLALLYQHEPGPRFRSILSRLLIYGAVISILMLIVVGEFGRHEVLAALLLLPGVAAGFSVSGPLARHLDRGHTRRAILGVSAISAVVVIVRAVL
jgi:uncharacterized membrane protein YfcA